MRVRIGSLIHILAAEPAAFGSIRTKGTIRIGGAKPGDRLWFEGVDRKRRNLTVESIDHTPRWSSIVFSGRPHDLERVVTGTYIRGQSGANAVKRPALQATDIRLAEPGKEGSAYASDKQL